jgi:hypothetical protein
MATIDRFERQIKTNLLILRNRTTKHLRLLSFASPRQMPANPVTHRRQLLRAILRARKMTALMQADQTSGGGCDRPILLHYSVKGGHSAGVSLTQLVQDQTDELSFLWNETDGQ